MKNLFRAFKWKAVYYWTLLRAWANQGSPRWAYSIMLACALALTGCGSEPTKVEPDSSKPPSYKHQFVAFHIGEQDAQINEYATAGWTPVAFVSRDRYYSPAVVVLKRPLPVEVAKSKNGVRK